MIFLDIDATFFLELTRRENVDLHQQLQVSIFPSFLLRLAAPPRGFAWAQSRVEERGNLLAPCARSLHDSTTQAVAVPAQSPHRLGLGVRSADEFWVEVLAVDAHGAVKLGYPLFASKVFLGPVDTECGEG